MENTLRELYNDVERKLSWILQPIVWDSEGQRDMLEHVREARDNLRRIMREMGWKGEF